MTDDTPTKARKPYANRMPRPDCPICGTPVPRARSKYCGRACMAVGKQGVQRDRRVSDPIAHIRERCSITDEGCWEWQQALTSQGYGIVAISDYLHVSKLVHILTFTILVGPVPAGLELDHLCRNRACCNPEHLEPVTHAENVRRSEAAAVQRARHADRTHCKRGHAFDEENTARDTRGHRRCRTCNREWAQRKAAS